MNYRTHFLRGLILFIIQFLILELLILLKGSIQWYLSALLPVAGVINFAIAWFLYLKKDNFLGPRRKRETEIPCHSYFANPPGKEKEPASPLDIEGQSIPYEGGFILSGFLLLVTATLLYFLFGTGSRYFL
jgi:hypothetical protein